jgi:hypothetical protein
MILLAAILAGAVTGLILARLHKRPWMVPPLRRIWLVLVAFAFQLVIAFLPATSSAISRELAASGLTLSLVLLLIFCWVNRRTAGIGLLAIGLALNLLVMAANGGFMPISPATASHIFPPEIMSRFAEGDRFSYKDVLLATEQTRLPWLSDVFFPPGGFPYQFAFSPGDLLIAAGAFWLLVSPPGRFPGSGQVQRKENP